MSDVNKGANPLFLRAESLHEAMEMLFFAYRDYTSRADEALADMGLGRAHVRVLYFVARNPGMTVSELLGLLRITKQSLSRVLATLVERGYIEQKTGVQDRRQRLLSLTEEGRALEKRLIEYQRTRVANAFRNAGGEAVEGFRAVLWELMDDEDRIQITSRSGNRKA